MLLLLQIGFVGKCAEYGDGPHEGLWSLLTRELALTMFMLAVIIVT